MWITRGGGGEGEPIVHPDDLERSCLIPQQDEVNCGSPQILSKTRGRTWSRDFALYNKVRQQTTTATAMRTSTTLLFPRRDVIQESLCAIDTKIHSPVCH